MLWFGQHPPLLQKRDKLASPRSPVGPAAEMGNLGFAFSWSQRLDCRNWVGCEERLLVRSSALSIFCGCREQSSALILTLTLSLQDLNEKQHSLFVCCSHPMTCAWGRHWPMGMRTEPRESQRHAAGALTAPHLKPLHLSTFQLWWTNKPALLFKPAWVRFSITCHRKSSGWFKCLLVLFELHPDALPWY